MREAKQPVWAAQVQPGGYEPQHVNSSWAGGAYEGGSTVNCWRRRSNLVDMSHDMSIQFGQEVPLYSKPPNWPASPPPAAQPFARPQSTFQAHNPIHGCALLTLEHVASCMSWVGV